MNADSTGDSNRGIRQAGKCTCKTVPIGISAANSEAMVPGVDIRCTVNSEGMVPVANTRCTVNFEGTVPMADGRNAVNFEVPTSVVRAPNATNPQKIRGRTKNFRNNGANRIAHEKAPGVSIDSPGARKNSRNYKLDDSPPLIDPMAPQTPKSLSPEILILGDDTPAVWALIVSETKRTLPSPRPTFTPPE